MVDTQVFTIKFFQTYYIFESFHNKIQEKTDFSYLQNSTSPLHLLKKNLYNIVNNMLSNILEKKNNSGNPACGYLSKCNELFYSRKNLYANVYIGFIHSSQIWK